MHEQMAQCVTGPDTRPYYCSKSSLIKIKLMFYTCHFKIVLNIRMFQIERDDLEKKALNLKIVLNNDYHYMLYDAQIYKSIDIGRSLMTC